MGEKSAASKKSGRLQKIGWWVGCFPNKFLGCVFREVRRWWRPRKASWDAEAMCVLKFGRATRHHILGWSSKNNNFCGQEDLFDAL